LLELLGQPVRIGLLHHLYIKMLVLS
jgi:hypothetical protein